MSSRPINTNLHISESDKINIATPSDRQLRSSSNMLHGNDREFFLRVWSVPQKIYIDRLYAIGFAGRQTVLDAGSGMGQWSAALASLNTNVISIELSRPRVNTSAQLFSALGIENVKVVHGSIDNVHIKDESIDAVFCYSVIMMTDFQKALAEFYRILKPKGRIYICANGVGYYYRLLIDQPNASAAYDPRTVAAEAIADSLSYYSGSTGIPSKQLVIPSKVMVSALRSAGFKSIRVGGEGALSVGGRVVGKQFFQSEYMKCESVYEVLAKRG